MAWRRTKALCLSASVSFFRRVRINCKKGDCQLRHAWLSARLSVFLSVRTHGSTPLALGRFSWNLIFENLFENLYYTVACLDIPYFFHNILQNFYLMPSTNANQRTSVLFYLPRTHFGNATHSEWRHITWPLWHVCVKPGCACVEAKPESAYLEWGHPVVLCVTINYKVVQIWPGLICM